VLFALKISGEGGPGQLYYSEIGDCPYFSYSEIGDCPYYSVPIIQQKLRKNYEVRMQKPTPPRKMLRKMKE